MLLRFAFTSVSPQFVGSNAIVDSLNRKTMRSVVQEYRFSDELEVHERAALSSIIDQVRNRRVLDIGVGAGRTVKPLREITDNYVGVDYVREMVDHCRSRFPDARFEHADARTMGRHFAPGSFDLVVFACNGICMVDHVDRLQILREIHQVLAPGGFFLFSTSNVNDPSRKRFLKLPPFEVSSNPARFVARGGIFLGETAFRLFNRVRNRRHEVRTAEYEILNGGSHHYRTMLYYISLKQQRRQLEQVGFQAGATAFDLSGRKIVEGDTQDGTLTFVARKPAHSH